MLDGHAVGLDACRDLGISIFAGEAEGRLDAVLKDAAAGRLAPVYNFMNDLPGLEGTVVPFLPKHISQVRSRLCSLHKSLLNRYLGISAGCRPKPFGE